MSKKAKTSTSEKMADGKEGTSSIMMRTPNQNMDTSMQRLTAR